MYIHSISLKQLPVFCTERNVNHGDCSKDCGIQTSEEGKAKCIIKSVIPEGWVAGIHRSSGDLNSRVPRPPPWSTYPYGYYCHRQPTAQQIDYIVLAPNWWEAAVPCPHGSEGQCWITVMIFRSLKPYSMIEC